MKEPIKPRKPSKPSKPTEPQEFCKVNEWVFDIRSNSSISLSEIIKKCTKQIGENYTDNEIFIEFEEGYYGGCEHEAIVSVRVDKDYKNPSYDKDKKKYNAKLKRYNKKIKEYQPELYKYEIQLKEYNKLKNEYDAFQKQEEIKRLESRLKKLKG